MREVLSYSRRGSRFTPSQQAAWDEHADAWVIPDEAVDAVWVLEHLVAPGSLAALWTFFPDPWPKKKHHKRRLVDADFAALAADRLAPDAEWRLATDWADYADQMREVLDAEPRLTGGPVERWSERPVTKFERKGLAVGREITDLCYRRLPSPA